MHLTALLGAFVTALPVLAAQSPAPNVLLVVADDFGVDLVGAYGEGAAPPCTPAIDSLAADGRLFRNAWANPACSPTRAALLTGRYGFRTGVGAPGAGLDLALSELTLPEALRDSPLGYSTAAFGKWHLTTPNNAMHPNLSGFDHFAGAISGTLPSYFSWPKVVNGVSQTETTYVTLDTTEDALAMIATLPEPWFVYVAYHAPHTPFHAPPAELCPPVSSCPNSTCSSSGGASQVEQLKAMVEVLDHQFGRILEVVDDSDTFVVFMGDNGTANQGSEPPFSAGKAKGSVFEGGVNVPLLVRGPGILPGETGALVGVTDLFATVGDLTGTGLTAEDSVSFASVLADPAARPRSTVYSETFEPNGSSLPIADHDYTVRDDRYKLQVRAGFPDSLFDLSADPFENNNLLPGGSDAVLGIYDRLRGEVEALQGGADLVALPSSVSLVNGGAQQLILSPGADSAGDVYFVLGSATGTAPGIPVGGSTLPLVFDAYTQLSLTQPNSALFASTLGTLGLQGTAQAAIVVPEGLSLALAGVDLHHAYVTIETTTGVVGLASTAGLLTLTL